MLIFDINVIEDAAVLDSVQSTEAFFWKGDARVNVNFSLVGVNI